MSSQSQLNFKQFDTVYTKDGEKYSFDHVVGEWAYVAQYYQIEIQNYDGEGFDEAEEVSEFLTRVPLAGLSSEKWVPVIEADTAVALAAKKAQLVEVSTKIGTATLELRAIQGQHALAEKKYQSDLAVLHKKYSFVKDIQSLTGETPLYFVYNYSEGRHPQPCVVNHIDRVVFIREEGKFVCQSIDTDDQFTTRKNIEIFRSEISMQVYVRELFLRRPVKGVEHETKWIEMHPFLSAQASGAAMEAISEKAEALRASRRNAQLSIIKNAQYTLDQMDQAQLGAGGPT